MAISAGSDALASDFINTSAGAGSAGKGVLLNASGLIDYTMLPANINKIFTAGENISAGNAVSLGAGSSYLLYDGSGNTGTQVGSDILGAQSFVTSSRAISIVSAFAYFSSNEGNGSKDYTISIYANSGGLPTGSALVTKTINYTNKPAGIIDLTFDTPLSVSPSTTYWVVANSGHFGGFVVKKTSGSGGAEFISGSWNSSGAYAYPKYISVREVNTISGRVYKSKSALSSDEANNFIGFANEAITAGNTGRVNLVGVDTNQSSLTVGATYYLSDTAGAISTSAGTISKKVGKALSATSILIKNDNE